MRVTQERHYSHAAIVEMVASQFRTATAKPEVHFELACGKLNGVQVTITVAGQAAAVTKVQLSAAEVETNVRKFIHGQFTAESKDLQQLVFSLDEKGNLMVKAVSTMGAHLKDWQQFVGAKTDDPKLSCPPKIAAAQAAST